MIGTWDIHSMSLIFPSHCSWCLGRPAPDTPLHCIHILAMLLLQRCVSTHMVHFIYYTHRLKLHSFSRNISHLPRTMSIFHFDYQCTKKKFVIRLTFELRSLPNNKNNKSSNLPALRPTDSVSVPSPSAKHNSLSYKKNYLSHFSLCLSYAANWLEIPLTFPRARILWIDQTHSTG